METLDVIFSMLIERPLLFVLVALFPFLLIGALTRTYPTARAALLMLIPLALSLFSLFGSVAATLALIVDALLLVVLVLDLFLIPARKTFQFERRMDRVFSLGKGQISEIEITYSGRQPCRVELVDDLPVKFVSEPESYPLELAPRSRKLLKFRLTSSHRGLFHLLGIHLCVLSRLQLWQSYYFYSMPTEAHVYPDMKQISEYGMLAKTNRLSLMGVRRTRKVGQDNEFERLREYTRDDNHRHIDWRATARKRRLMVKDFQNNQNQTIVFLVDCGRMMSGHSGSITMLDHALNAMLMMSYVALKRGDSVGLITFSNRVHRYTPPRSGARHLNRLLHAVFDQHAQQVESRYDDAFFYLNQHCRKRSLVVLITNLIDRINASQVERYLQNSSGRHLPMGVFLRDHDLYDPIDEFLELPAAAQIGADYHARQQLFQAAAASDIARWRHQSITALQYSGILMLDVFPEQLTASLVNKYLEIKARHLL